jgi:hypothetical protein
VIISGSANLKPKNTEKQQPRYRTIREVADLLCVEQQKIFGLAAANEVPHRRITGKLLFPDAGIVAWTDGRFGREACGSHRPSKAA